MAFFVDDILLAPLKGFMFIVRHVHQEAMEALLDEPGTRQQLRELYRQLENGELSEEAFEVQEAELVERLEAIEAYKQSERR